GIGIRVQLAIVRDWLFLWASCYSVSCFDADGIHLPVQLPWFRRWIVDWVSYQFHALASFCGHRPPAFSKMVFLNLHLRIGLQFISGRRPLAGLTTSSPSENLVTHHVRCLHFTMVSV